MWIHEEKGESLFPLQSGPWDFIFGDRCWFEWATSRWLGSVPFHQELASHDLKTGRSVPK
jgi:hypothetical protein